MNKDQRIIKAFFDKWHLEYFGLEETVFENGHPRYIYKIISNCNDLTKEMPPALATEIAESGQAILTSKCCSVPTYHTSGRGIPDYFCTNCHQPVKPTKSSQKEISDNEIAKAASKAYPNLGKNDKLSVWQKGIAHIQKTLSTPPQEPKGDVWEEIERIKEFIGMDTLTPLFNPDKE